MNLDDLMTVWKSQNSSPLHGVNEAILRLALQQDETKVQKRRRRERWIIYGIVTLNVVLLAQFLFVMIYRPHKVALSGWDYAIPVAGVVAGVAAALLIAGRFYVRQREQAVREQRFGESLRDQINRQLAQCTYAATRMRPASRLGIRLLVIISLAGILASRWIHDRTFSEARLWGLVGFIACWIVIVRGGSWMHRRFVEQKILPRQRQLEALLKELDGE